MADSENAEGIGSVAVSITGDYGPLKATFSAAQTDAQTAGGAIASAFTAAAGAIDPFVVAVEKAVAAGHTMAEAIQMAGGTLGTAGDAASAAAGQFNEFSDAAQRIIDADQKLQTETAQAAAALQELHQGYEQGTVSASALARAQQELADKQGKVKESTDAATASAGDFLMAGLKLAGLAIGVETIKGLYTAALEAYSSLENATIAITHMTGSAQTAAAEIGKLRDVATSNALNFDNLLTAEQRAVAFGFSLKSIHGALQAAADDAAATGNSFEGVAQKLTMVSESGNLMPRTLATLGLSLRDVGDVMGVTAEDAKAAFKALDQSERLEVLTQALGKFKGAAGDMAQGLSGQFQNLQTQSKFAFQEIGKAIAPVASELLTLANTGMKAATEGFKSLNDVVGNVAGTIGPVIGQIKAVAGAAGDFYQVLGPLKGIMGEIGTLFKDWNTYTLVLGDRWYSLGNVLANTTQLITGTSKAITDMDKASADAEKKLQTLGTTGSAAADALAASFARAKLDAQGFIGVAASVAEGILAIRSNISDAKDVFQNSKQIYDTLVASLANGKATQQEVDLAWQNLTTAARNAGVQMAPLPGSMEAINAAAVKLGGTTVTYAGNLDVANAKILAEKSALDLAEAAWETARAKLKILADQVTELAKSHDTSTAATNKLKDAQLALRDQMNVLIEKDKEYTQATDILNQNQGIQTSTVTGLGRAFDFLAGVMRNIPSEANNFGIEIVKQTGQIGVLRSALDEARATLQKWTDKQAEGADVGREVVKAQKQVLDAQIALDQQNAVNATGTVGLTDKVSLYKQELVAAEAKLKALTQAAHDGTVQANALAAAQDAVTRATDNLKKAQDTLQPALSSVTTALSKQVMEAANTGKALDLITDAAVRATGAMGNLSRAAGDALMAAGAAKEKYLGSSTTGGAGGSVAAPPGYSMHVGVGNIGEFGAYQTIVTFQPLPETQLKLNQQAAIAEADYKSNPGNKTDDVSLAKMALAEAQALLPIIQQGLAGHVSGITAADVQSAVQAVQSAQEALQKLTGQSTPAAAAGSGPADQSLQNLMTAANDANKALSDITFQFQQGTASLKDLQDAQQNAAFWQAQLNTVQGGGGGPAAAPSAGAAVSAAPMETAAAGGTYPGVVIHQAAGEYLNVLLAGNTAAAAAASVGAGGTADLGVLAGAAGATASAISAAASALVVSTDTLSDVAGAMAAISGSLRPVSGANVVGGTIASGMPRGFTGRWTDGKQYENGALANGMINGTLYINGVAQTSQASGNSMGTTFNGTEGQQGHGYLPTAEEFQRQLQQSQGIIVHPFEAIDSSAASAITPGAGGTQPAAAVANPQPTVVQSFDFSGGNWAGANPGQLQAAMMGAVREIRTLGGRW